MAEPHPAVAAVRVAVRGALRDASPRALVLAAVSGGADSLALMAAIAFEAPRCGRRAGVVHVDHGLQAGSPEQARRVAAQAVAVGIAPADVHLVQAGDPVGRHTSEPTEAGPDVPGEGPEGRARRARYASLEATVTSTGAEWVYLGHTRDDQAEQVLLGLARGSGPRSLAGMPRIRGCYRRPLLDLRHDTLVDACRHLGLQPWEDPTNADPAYTRNRVRHRVLPLLESELGPGVAAALARTAELLRADADLLDVLAAEAWAACTAGQQVGEPPTAVELSVGALAALPGALRSRVVRAAIVRAGAPPGDVALSHTRAVEALVDDWHGQGPISLPRGLVAVRRCDRLVFEAP